MAGKIPVPVVLLFALEALLGLLHVVFASLFPDLHPGLNDLFNLYRENNIPTWFSSVQLALVGVVFGLFAWAQRQKGDMAWPMVLAALAFLFLSLDEVAQIHEKIGMVSDVLLPGGDRTNTVFWRSGIWMFLLGPLLLGAFWLWWKAANRWLNGFPHRGKFIAGMLLFVLAATVPEILSNFVTSHSLRLMLVLVEELGEMVGVTLILWGTYELCVFHQVPVPVNSPSRPR